MGSGAWVRLDEKDDLDDTICAELPPAVEVTHDASKLLRLLLSKLPPTCPPWSQTERRLQPALAS